MCILLPAFLREGPASPPLELNVYVVMGTLSSDTSESLAHGAAESQQLALRTAPHCASTNALPPPLFFAGPIGCMVARRLDDAAQSTRCCGVIVVALQYASRGKHVIDLPGTKKGPTESLREEEAAPGLPAWSRGPAWLAGWLAA